MEWKKKIEIEKMKNERSDIGTEFKGLELQNSRWNLTKKEKRGYAECN